jgi:hypothetical protein
MQKEIRVGFESKNIRVEKIGMGTKPDPYNYTIKSIESINGNTIILANYIGCTTFGGDKLMVLKGIHNNFLTLDPHFFEDHPVIARFAPTLEGFRLAKLVAENI